MKQSTVPKSATSFGRWLSFIGPSFDAKAGKNGCHKPYLCMDVLSEYFDLPTDPDIHLPTPISGLRIRPVLTLNRPRWNAIQLCIKKGDMHGLGNVRGSGAFLGVRTKAGADCGVMYEATLAYPLFWRFVKRFCHSRGVSSCWMHIEYTSAIETSRGE